MVWLYRLQQRLSITRNEGFAVLTLTVLFVTGLTVRHVQNQQVPPVAVDSLVVHSPASPPDTSQSSASPSPAAPSPENPVNLNAASKTSLKTLTGIGPALAERILDYRSSQRPFQRVEELKRVRGIGPKTLADLRPVVTVNPDEAP